MTIRHVKYIKTSQTKKVEANVNDENGNASLVLFVDPAIRNASTMRPSMRHKLLFIRDLHNFCNAEAFLRISTLNVNAKRKHK